MGIYKLLIVSFLSISTSLAFAMVNSKDDQENSKIYHILPIKAGNCILDDFERNLCTPPTDVFTLYKLRLSKDLTKIVVKSIFTDDLIKAQSLINVEATAKIDTSNVYWIVEEKDINTNIAVGMLYRQTYLVGDDLEESYSVMRLGLEKTCLVANLLSERFGPEVDLFKAAERLALNIETSTCL